MIISEFRPITEKSCGTCEYFTSDHSNTTSGTCWWATKNPVPIAYTDNISITYSTWGEDCPCWTEKNSPKKEIPPMTDEQRFWYIPNVSC